ncbi:rhodanese-like domain-containing protein [Devosia riboflavina]
MTDTAATDTRRSAEHAVQAIRNGALLIDVRSELGRGRDGELKEAIVVAKADVLPVLSRRLRPANDDQPVVIFCGSVKGSGPVVDALVEAGFRNIFDVDGGFSALRDGGIDVLPRATPPAAS